MAKSDLNGVVAILEYLDRKNTFKPPAPKSKGRFGKRKVKEFDLVELLRVKKEETDALERFLEEQNKLKKKEEKKEEKKPQRILIGIEWFIIGVLAYPVIGYLQTLTPVLK